MRRSLVLIAFFTALLVGGLWAGKTFAPCSRPIAALAKVGLKVSAECPLPRSRRSTRRARSSRPP